MGTGETERTIPVNTEGQFDAPVDGLADSEIQSIEWSMGDGTSKTGQSISHTYTSTEEYSALVTVTSTDGKSVSSGLTVIVESADSTVQYKPVARPDIISDAVSEGVEAKFSGSSSEDYDGEITSYEWDFDGDGTVDATGELVDYTYSSMGPKTASLTVTDDDGATATRDFTVNVESGTPDDYSDEFSLTTRNFEYQTRSLTHTLSSPRTVSAGTPVSLTLDVTLDDYGRLDYEYSSVVTKNNGVIRVCSGTNCNYTPNQDVTITGVRATTYYHAGGSSNYRWYYEGLYMGFDSP